MSVTTERHDEPIVAPIHLGDRASNTQPERTARRIQQLTPDERPAALEALPEGEEIAAFLEMRPQGQASVLEHMDRERAARLADRLPFNTLARVLDYMGAAACDATVRNLRPLKRNRVETVLAGRLRY